MSWKGFGEYFLLGMYVEGSRSKPSDAIVGCYKRVREMRVDWYIQGSRNWRPLVVSLRR